LSILNFLISWKPSFRDDIQPAEISEALLFTFAIVFRHIEEPDSDSIVLIDAYTLFLKCMDECTTESLLQKTQSNQLSLYDNCIIGSVILFQSLTKGTWEAIELNLWKTLLASQKDHLWLFIIELFIKLSKYGTSFLIGFHELKEISYKIVKNLFTSTTISFSHHRLGVMADFLNANNPIETQNLQTDVTFSEDKVKSEYFHFPNIGTNVEHGELYFEHLLDMWSNLTKCLEGTDNNLQVAGIYQTIGLLLYPVITMQNEDCWQHSKCNNMNLFIEKLSATSLPLLKGGLGLILWLNEQKKDCTLIFLSLGNILLLLATFKPFTKSIQKCSAILEELQNWNSLDFPNSFRFAELKFILSISPDSNKTKMNILLAKSVENITKEDVGQSFQQVCLQLLENTLYRNLVTFHSAKKQGKLPRILRPMKKLNPNNSVSSSINTIEKFLSSGPILTNIAQWRRLLSSINSAILRSE
jgi:hypothetical protein